ncbi:hypothetical protein MB46_07480 [Arthrobacter alpinus]|nr:hypothetical protein MB46_07480 [Arthrobacter alpinus]
MCVIVALIGLVAAFTGLVSYITRYANLDSLDGTIDSSLYEQITQMFVQEKTFLFGGIILAIIGAIGIAPGIAARSRAIR